MRKKASNKIGLRTWLALLVFGLIGQVAWVVENMYFNVFLYNTISGDTNLIAAMVACSSADRWGFTPHFRPQLCSQRILSQVPTTRINT